ncbi:MAG: GNAT family N-acetyltransferase [Chloroflexi bacterium]|nr:GNAT family N-acetyltransferase [Chloroflexota bacterium]
MLSSPVNKAVLHALDPVPERLLGIRQELNLLWYGPSQVLIAQDDSAGIIGAVRLAYRHDPRRCHGLIADLQIDPEWRDRAVEEQLIQAAEEALGQGGVTKIDVLIPDGQRWASCFYRLGYWPSRKTVVIIWDLTDLRPAHESPEFTVELLETPDVDSTTDLVLASYQPYWQWWKEQKEDQKWFRAEYPVGAEPPDSADLAVEMRARVRAAVEQIAERPDHVLFLARHQGRPVGLCDARVGGTSDEDNFAFGVLVLRDFGGKRLGSVLLGRALHWLRARGLSQARVTTTSGLDDYDPTVYLYTLSYGGQIAAEYVNLVKRR